MPVSRYEEEISVGDYIQIIIKRKAVVLSITFLALIITGIINFSMPKTYEVNAVIQNGYVTAPVFTYAETAALLKSRSFSKPIFDKYGVNFPGSEKAFKKMFVIENINETNFFVIKIRYKDKDIVYSLAQEIINNYINLGKSAYNSKIILLENGVANLDNLIEKTRLSMEGGKNISSQKEFSFPRSIPDEKAQLKDLLTEKLRLESQISLTKEFKVIDEPVKPIAPISPNILKNMEIAFMLGIMLGVFFACFVEAWKKSETKI